MGVTERVWSALTSMIKLEDKVTRQAHSFVKLEAVLGEEPVDLRRRLAARAFQNSVVLRKQGRFCSRHSCIHFSELRHGDPSRTCRPALRLPAATPGEMARGHLPCRAARHC